MERFDVTDTKKLVSVEACDGQFVRSLGEGKDGMRGELSLFPGGRFQRTDRLTPWSVLNERAGRNYSEMLQQSPGVRISEGGGTARA